MALELEQGKAPRAATLTRGARVPKKHFYSAALPEPLIARAACVSSGRAADVIGETQETFRTAASTTNDLFLLRHISMRAP